MRDVRAFLEDMVVSARLAIRYAGDRTVDDLLDDVEKQDSIIHRIELIGEAARNVPDDVRLQIDLPWPKIVALRNLLAHQYWGVDLNRILAVVRTDLPALIAAIEPHL